MCLQIAEFLRTPFIKFLSSTVSYITFVCMIIAYSVTEEAGAGYTISQHDGMGARFASYQDECSARNSSICQPDESVRYHRLGYGTIVLSVWIIGECTVVYIIYRPTCISGTWRVVVVTL